MSPTERRRWCLNQAIELVKSAPADGLPTHERLKRVYKRLLELTKADEQSSESPTRKS